MKKSKILSSLLLLSSVFTLAACTSFSKSSESKTDESMVEVTEKDKKELDILKNFGKEYKIGSVFYYGYEVKVNDVKYNDLEGKKLAIVNVTINNKTKGKDAPVNDTYFDVVSGDKRISVNMRADYEDKLTPVTLKSGEGKTFNLAFDVPAKGDLQLNFNPVSWQGKTLKVKLR